MIHIIFYLLSNPPTNKTDYLEFEIEIVFKGFIHMYKINKRLHCILSTVSKNKIVVAFCYRAWFDAGNRQTEKDECNAEDSACRAGSSSHRLRTTDWKRLGQISLSQAQCWYCSVVSLLFISLSLRFCLFYAHLSKVIKQYHLCNNISLWLLGWIIRLMNVSEQS